MGKVLKADCSAGDAWVRWATTHAAPWYIEFDVAIVSATAAVLNSHGDTSTGDLIELGPVSGTFGNDGLYSYSPSVFSSSPAEIASEWTGTPFGSLPHDTWTTIKCHYNGSTVTWTIGASSSNDSGVSGGSALDGTFQVGGTAANHQSGEIYYFDNVKMGTTLGGSDIFSDDFESGGLSAWSSTHGSVSVVDDPIAPPPALAASFTGTPTAGSAPLSVAFTDTSTPGPSGPITAWAWDFGDGHTSSTQNPSHTFGEPGHYDITLTITGTGADGTDSHLETAYILVGGGAFGRVLVAWNDGPLEPNPTWFPLDQGDPFPEQFVAGFDTKNGRQTLLAQTETGTATVYINDHELGLFDDRNLASPYRGKLSGRQIMLQIWNPVTATWEPQFRGLIDSYTYDIDGSATDANGDPINASIQIECVDMFDYLEEYGLTPGLDGVTPRSVPSGGTLGGAPPTGMEDGVYYATTAGSVDDRIIQILTDASVDPDRYIVASGNTKVIAVKYDPDESALAALRDAADAEIPFVANIYINRYGQFVFRGRYSRFAPDAVAAEPLSEWDFTRWAVGDEKAIKADPTRGQMRDLSYIRDRGDLINVALCYPQATQAADMPNQVYANAPSITAYGRHNAPPMSDLLTGDYTGPGTLSPDSTGKTQCYLFAKLLVLNKKDPRVSITALQVKTLPPDDYRAAATWDVLTRADISHIINVRVGYPGGTGFAGGSPEDDYYIEGRSLVVRPLGTSEYDYVELNLEVSPAVWSMDTHNVFPSFDADDTSPTLSADFTVAE